MIIEDIHGGGRYFFALKQQTAPLRVPFRYLSRRSGACFKLRQYAVYEAVICKD